MIISFMSELIGLFLSFIVIIGIQITFSFNKNGISLEKIKFLLVCCLLAVIRISMPLEFSFTKTIGCSYVLPVLAEGLKKDIYGIKLKDLLLMLSLGVSLIIGLNRMQSYIRLKKILKYSKPIDISMINKVMIPIETEYNKKIKLKIVQLSYISEPIIIGLVRPIIILPKNCVNSTDLPYILKHEVEHYLHHDIWMKALTEALCIVQWWNPLVYILRFQLTNVLEFHDDLIISKKATEKERIKYLECLLVTAKEKNMKKPHMSLGFQQVSEPYLKKRFLSILNYKNRHLKKRYWFVYFIPICLFILSLCVVIEPYYITEDKTESSFVFDKDSTFLQEEGDGYSIMVKGKKEGWIKSIPPEMRNIEIKEKINEK